MPSQRNIKTLADLTDRISRAKSVVFADHTGLTMPEISDLRTKVKAVGGDITVAKNTLLELALEQAQSSKLKAQSYLSGPTSILLSYEDEILPIKALAEFSKSHEKPVIKAGLLGDRTLTKNEVLELARLPGKEGLVAMLLARLQNPAYGLVSVLQGNARKLVYALQARKDQLD